MEIKELVEGIVGYMFHPYGPESAFEEWSGTVERIPYMYLDANGDIAGSNMGTPDMRDFYNHKSGNVMYIIYNEKQDKEIMRQHLENKFRLQRAFYQDDRN